MDTIKIKTQKKEEIIDITRELIEEAGCRSDGFLEIQREGSTIVQLGLFRIVILRPPFSDNWEITAVRPVRKLKMGDHELSEKIKKPFIQASRRNFDCWCSWYG